MGKITAKEIAARMGISAAAVSLAINGKRGVSEETRAQVFAVCEEMGYPIARPTTEPAPAVPQKKTLCFMIFVDDLLHIWENSPFYTFNMQGVASAATDHGYNTLIRYLQTDEILSQANLDFLKTVDGLVLLGTDVNHRCVDDIRTMLDSIPATPKVVLDSMMLFDRADSIGNDNFGGAYQAVSYLAERGCKKISYLCSHSRIAIFEEREAGLHAALKDANLPLFGQMHSGVSNDDAYADVDNWLSEGHPLPDAIFADNDVIAAAAVRAMAAHGIKIPEQVSIIGFDNIPVTEQTNPPLATIHSYKDGLGATAVNLLIQRQWMNDHAQGLQSGFLKVQMSTRLVPRKSVR